MKKKRILESVEKNEISTYGRNVSLFEKNISKLTGAKYNLAVNSGSSALLLAFKSLGVKKNDLIITQSYTFTATTNSIIHSGGKPWLFDINKENFSINLEDIQKSLIKKCYKKGKFYYHKNTKQRVFAICPVFSFSIIPRLDELQLLAKKFNLKIILILPALLMQNTTRRTLSHLLILLFFPLMETNHLPLAQVV